MITATEVITPAKIQQLMVSGDFVIAPDLSDLKGQSAFMLYVGVGAFFACWSMVSFMSVFAENIAFKTRVYYFRKMLEKDAGFYDEHSATSVASRITKESSAIQRGIGEKVGQTVMSVGMFLVGFVFAFFLGWLYTLILIASVPILGCAGGLMSAALMSGMAEAMRAYAQSAGYAEQALQAIKVVHTYGQEKLEHRIYSSQLEKARQNSGTQTIKSACGQGSMFLIFFGFYCYGFFFGGYLRWNEVKSQSGEPYKSGTIIAIMFMVVFGAF